MSLKSKLKLLKHKFRLRNVNYTNLHAWASIGKYTIIRTDISSIIELNDHLDIQNYVSIVSELEGTIRFGKNIYIGDYSTIRATRAEVIIGSNVLIGQYVKIISTNHAYSKKSVLIKDQDIIEDKKGIIIGDDCWIGAGSALLPGIKIGNGAVVGANSVVTKNVPDYAIVIGNPAKILKFRE